jgi:hypothetical protein
MEIRSPIDSEGEESGRSKKRGQSAHVTGHVDDFNVYLNSFETKSIARAKTSKPSNDYGEQPHRLNDETLITKQTTQTTKTIENIDESDKQSIMSTQQDKTDQ